MATLEINGKTIPVDEDGYLENLEDWDKEVAAFLAKQEGIDTLTDGHWAVIEVMQKTFKETGTGPSLRKLSKASGVPTKELYQLFPKGPAKKAAKVAGIPKPTGCV